MRWTRTGERGYGLRCRAPGRGEGSGSSVLCHGSSNPATLHLAARGGVFFASTEPEGALPGRRQSVWGSAFGPRLGRTHSATKGRSLWRSGRSDRPSSGRARNRGAGRFRGKPRESASRRRRARRRHKQTGGLGEHASPAAALGRIPAHPAPSHPSSPSRRQRRGAPWPASLAPASPFPALRPIATGARPPPPLQSPPAAHGVLTPGRRGGQG